MHRSVPTSHATLDYAPTPTRSDVTFLWRNNIIYNTERCLKASIIVKMACRPAEYGRKISRFWLCVASCACPASFTTLCYCLACASHHTRSLRLAPMMLNICLVLCSFVCDLVWLVRPSHLNAGGLGLVPP